MPLSSSTAQRIDKTGLIGILCAFFIWGLFPIYLKPLNQVAAGVLTAVRAISSCAVVLIVLGLRGELQMVRSALTGAATRWRLLCSALCMSINWGVYVWGVANHHVIETSLGYFINPLVNVFLGVWVLSEKLNRAQWSAVALAACGVGYLTWEGGHPPWIALSLAFSFSFYGLIRKITPVAALPGLACEMSLLAPVAIGVLAVTQMQAGLRLHPEPLTAALLILSGPVSVIPLALFAFGAQRLPYAMVGMLQYLTPTLQLLVGILLYREPFAGPRVLGFCLIWLGLLIYALESFWRSRSSKSL